MPLQSKEKRWIKEIKYTEVEIVPEFHCIATPKNMPMATVNPELTVMEYDKRQVPKGHIEKIKRPRTLKISKIKYWWHSKILGYKDLDIVNIFNSPQ